MKRSKIVTAETNMDKLIAAVATLSGRGFWADGPFSTSLAEWLKNGEIIGMQVGTIADEWAVDEGDY